jgi:hypothetical protein
MPLRAITARDEPAATRLAAWAEPLLGPLQRRDAGADALVDQLQTFVLRSVGVTHTHA